MTALLETFSVPYLLVIFVLNYSKWSGNYYCRRCEDVLFQVQRAKAGLMNAPLIEILKEVCLVHYMRVV